MNIPKGFNTVTPYFFVTGADKFVDFLIAAFGGEELGRSTSPDGQIANAQIRIGTSIVITSEAPPQYKPMHNTCYLYVENADAAMKKALENTETAKAASQIHLVISGGYLNGSSTLLTFSG